MTEFKKDRRRLDGAWVAYLDAYGFSAAVERKTEHIVEKFFSELYEELDAIVTTLDAAYQFSDSIFLIQKPFPDPQTKLQELYSAVQNLQKIALQYSLAFRGAVAFGTVTIGPFGCFGQPVVDAARLEEHLAVPLVVLPERFIEQANNHLFSAYSPGARVELTTQLVKTKTGSILANVIPPPLRLFANIAHKKIRHSLVHGPDHIAASWQSAIDALNLTRVDDTGQ